MVYLEPVRMNMERMFIGHLHGVGDASKNVDHIRVEHLGAA